MGRKSKYSDAEIASFLREATQGTSVREVCRRHGFTEKTFYRWRARFAARPPVSVAAGIGRSRDLRDLEDENRRLRDLVAQLSLDNWKLREARTRIPA